MPATVTGTSGVASYGSLGHVPHKLEKAKKLSDEIINANQ
jgi:hypothetical protein